MFKMVTRILGVIALTGWMGAANATLIFDFSWDSDNGKIIGEISFSSGNGLNMEATEFVLTSVDGTDVDFDLLDAGFWTLIDNDFHVVDGQIRSFYFRASQGRGYNISLDSRPRTWSGGVEHHLRYDRINYRSNSITFVKRVTVPEPSSVILMLLGLAGLSFARYRKQS